MPTWHTKYSEATALRLAADSSIGCRAHAASSWSAVNFEKELARDRRFFQWLRSALRNGRARSVPDEVVDDHASRLRREGGCISNDPHVLALALVSGARLLYTNDTALIEDFGNREIVARPRGKVYTTARTANVTDAHQRLLAARDLCRAPRG